MQSRKAPSFLPLCVSYLKPSQINFCKCIIIFAPLKTTQQKTLGIVRFAFLLKAVYNWSQGFFPDTRNFLYWLSLNWSTKPPMRKKCEGGITKCATGFRKKLHRTYVEQFHSYPLRLSCVSLDFLFLNSFLNFSRNWMMWEELFIFSGNTSGLCVTTVELWVV